MQSTSSSERGAPPSPWPRLVGIVAGITAVLAIVAVASRGHHTPIARGGTSRAPSQVFADVFFTLLVCGMVATVIFVAYMHTLKRAQPKKRMGSGGGPLIGLVYLALLAGLAVYAADRAAHGHRGRLPRVARPAPAAAAAQRKGGVPRPHRPHIEWALAAGIAALGAAAVVVPLVRRRVAVRRYVREQRIAEELSAVLDESLDDLRHEADPRRAVIAAYARMERILAAEGLGRRTSEAPFEYLARVLTELRASRVSTFALTELYERAEFSTHAVDDEMRGEAIAALTTVRNDLAAVAA